MQNSRNFLVRRLFCLALVAAFLGLGLAGCTGSKITKENFDQIKLGMTQAEVERLLGPPTEATGLELPVFAGTMSKWARGDTVISVQFINGKVVAKEFSKPAKK